MWARRSTSSRFHAIMTTNRSAHSRASPATCIGSLTGWGAVGITTIEMESTGVYWVPVFEILEARGFEVLLVNARHVKNVPGRKTDVNDARWLQQLHQHALLRDSFRPRDGVARLRALCVTASAWSTTWPRTSSTCRRR
jgi:transposase